MTDSRTKPPAEQPSYKLADPVEFARNMAGVFEQKIRTLAVALEHEDLEQRESARSTLRGFIDRIVIPPGDGLLHVVGNLGEMLTAAGAPREAAAVGNGGCRGVQPSGFGVRSGLLQGVHEPRHSPSRPYRKSVRDTRRRRPS